MKQEQVVGTRLPDTVVRDLETIEQVEQADRLTIVRKSSLGQYRVGSWTTIRVCMEAARSRWRALLVKARVSLWEMMDYVKTKKITAQYDLEDFQRDLKTVAAVGRR